MLNNIYVKECIKFKKLHFYTVNEQKKSTLSRQAQMVIHSSIHSKFII